MTGPDWYADFAKLDGAAETLFESFSFPRHHASEAVLRARDTVRAFVAKYGAPAALDRFFEWVRAPADPKPSPDPMAQHEWARDVREMPDDLGPVYVLFHELGWPAGDYDAKDARRAYRDLVSLLVPGGEWKKLAVPIDHPRTWGGPRRLAIVEDTAFEPFGFEKGRHAPGYWSLGDGAEALVYVVPLEAANE